jgi:hypothetical protein
MSPFFYVPLTKLSVVEWVLDPAPVYVPLGKWELHGLRYEPTADEDLTGIVITDFIDTRFSTRFLRPDTPLVFATGPFEDEQFIDLTIPAMIFSDSLPIPRHVTVPTFSVSVHLRVSAPLQGKFFVRARLSELP